jgi:hypothetical protein
MNPTRTVLLRASLALLATTLPAQNALAVALRPNKATDDSVCDLTHHTNLYLGSKTLVPSVAQAKDKVDAYFRLAGEFVAAKCRNGQLLMVQGDSASSVDVRSLTELANSSCAVASIARSEVTLSLGDLSYPGFELRCTILKHSELVDRLNSLERADPMDSLKARLAATAQQADRGPSKSDSNSQAKKDCDKMTLSSILQGGSCK